MSTKKNNSFFKPEYDISAKILSIIGLWYFQSKKQRNLRAIGFYLTYVSGLIPVFHASFKNPTADCLFSSLPIYTIIFISLVKWFNNKVNYKKIMHLFMLVEEEWKNLENGSCKNIMIKYTEQGRTISIIYTKLFFLATFLFMLLPFYPNLMVKVGLKEGPVDIEFAYPTDYWFDNSKYWLVVQLHLMIAAYVVMSTIIGYDTILIMLVQHICGVFAVITYRLEHITDGKNLNVNLFPAKEHDKGFQIISNCIKSHNRIIGFAKLLEDFQCWELLVIICSETLLITFTGVRLVSRLDDMAESVRYVSFALGQVLHVFFISAVAQRIIDCSTTITKTIINLQWYALSMRSRKLINLITLNSSVPCCLTAGRFFTLSLQFFISILQTSMSYFTLLRSVQEN